MKGEQEKGRWWIWL